MNIESFIIHHFNLPDARHTHYHLYNHSWSHKLSHFSSPDNLYSIEQYFIPLGNVLHGLSFSHWHTSFYIALCYLTVIFTLRNVMKNRKGFKLETPLFVWNLSLALFSIFGVCRCIPEFFELFKNDGLTATYTKASYFTDHCLSSWYLIFTLSKALELFDTVFVVLRKSKLLPLHWIHHVLTLTFSWFAYVDIPSTARWMVGMNFTVHSLMYSYYALKVAGYCVPQKVSFTITCIQVGQMFAGLFISYQCLRLKLAGAPVDISYSTAMCSFVLYAIFAAMFCQFFARSYIFSLDYSIQGKAFNGDDQLNLYVTGKAKQKKQ